jgi:hypothetical protein
VQDRVKKAIRASTCPTSITVIHIGQGLRGARKFFSQPRTFSRSAPQPVLLHASTPLVDPSRLYPLKEGLVYRRHSCVRYRAANGFPWKYSGTPAYDKCIAVPRICVRGTREFNSNKEVILVLLT